MGPSSELTAAPPVPALTPLAAELIDQLLDALADRVAERLESSTARRPLRADVAAPGAVEREWMSLAEAARYARVSPSTIARARRSGDLETREVGRRVLVRRAALEKWIHGGEA